MLKHTATLNGIVHIVFTMNLDGFWPGIHSKKGKLNPLEKLRTSKWGMDAICTGCLKRTESSSHSKKMRISRAKAKIDHEAN